MSLDAIIAESRKRGARALEVPARFVDFCEWIGVKLHPAQRVYCMVAYDGMQPTELDGADRELARVMFDGLFDIADEARTEVWTLAGGRAGKTYVLGALRLVWGALVRDLSSLQPGQEAVALSIAPKDIHRQEIINFQLGAMRSRPELKALIVRPRNMSDFDKPEWFVIKRPDGHMVTFEGGTCNMGGYAARGRALTDFLGDEAAFFRDKGVVNDTEIFAAASPRVLPGGQMIGQTTAWACLGYHYEQWRANYGHPVTAIAALATTEMLRPDAAGIVARERKKNPVNARREFDAIPMADAPEIFFSPALIDQCLDATMPFPLTPVAGDRFNPERNAAGADFGFRSNSSALSITHRSGDEMFLAMLRERQPQEGKPLRPSDTIAEFAATCREHGVSAVTADGHYRESVVEHLGKIGFWDVEAPPGDVFMRARTLMRDGRVRIPNPTSMPEGAERLAVERLMKQLQDTRGVAQAGGTYTIHLPKWPDGSHGDLAAAFALSLFRLGGEAKKEEPPKLGSAEWEEQQRAKRRSELTQRQKPGGLRR